MDISSEISLLDGFVQVYGPQMMYPSNCGWVEMKFGTDGHVPNENSSMVTVSI